MTDEYKTIRNEVHGESKVQGSRFIAHARPTITRADTEQFITLIRKQLFDATHHCYAYRLGTEGDQFRFNDDGEPAGSAGKPILAMIDKFGFTDITVVVTRYFGGTKLGVGGLIRAYGGTAREALVTAENLVKFKLSRITATFPHALISQVMHVVSKTGARIVDTVYDEEVHLTLDIRASKTDECRSFLIDQTSGNIRLS